MPLQLAVTEALVALRRLVGALELAARKQRSTPATPAYKARVLPSPQAEPADLLHLLECAAIALAEHLVAAADALESSAAQTTRVRQRRALRAHALLRQRARSVRDPLLRQAVRRIGNGLLRARAR